MQLLSDAIWFPIFEGALFLLFLVTLFYDLTTRTSFAKVQYNKETQEKLSNLFLLGTSVIVLAVVATTEAWNGYKTLTLILDFGILIYLSYFSPKYRLTAWRIIHWIEKRFEPFR